MTIHQHITIRRLGLYTKYFVRITLYCGFENYVRVFLAGDVSFSLSDDYIEENIFIINLWVQKLTFHHKLSES